MFDTHTRRALSRAEESLRTLAAALDERVHSKPSHRKRNVALTSFGAVLAAAVGLMAFWRLKLHAHEDSDALDEQTSEK